MSKRQDQVNSLLHRTLAEALVRGEVADPRMQGMVSVTRVDVSPDLHQAKVFVSVLPDKYEARVLAALHHAANHLRDLLRRQVRLRTIPRLEFRLDEGLKREARVLADIRDGMQRTAEHDAPPGTTGPTGEEPGPTPERDESDGR